MSKKPVIISLFGILILSIIFTFFPNNIFQVMQKPDTALAWIGLALASVLVLRGLAGEKIRGIIAVLFNIKNNKEVIGSFSRGWRYTVLKFSYWFAVGLLAFASFNLLIGTINDMRIQDTEITHQDIQELIERMDILIETLEVDSGAKK